MNAADAKAALRLVPGWQDSEPSPAPTPAPQGGAGVAPPASSPDTSAAPATSMPAGRWARYAGKLGSALTVTASAAAIRRGGHDPNMPDDADVDLLEQALEEGIRSRFGDAPVPWWMGAALAAGGVYASMRVGARRIEPAKPPAISAAVSGPASVLTPERTDPPAAAPAKAPTRSSIFPPSLQKP